jgi:multisubunit Na+/H+ antiporter MnhB subunit
MFDLKSPDFLGGNNVHNVIIIGLLGYLVYKASK